MPPKVVDCRDAAKQGDIAREATERLAAGQVAVFPTETVYGLAADARSEAGVTRLAELKERSDGHPMALSLSSPADILDYAPDMGTKASRLARRSMPGPVTLVVRMKPSVGRLWELPQCTRDVVLSSSSETGFRVPGHPLILDVAQRGGGPLVLTSANRRGMPAPTSLDAAVEAFGDDVDLYLDDGPTKYGLASTVTRADPEVEVLREGVIDESTLRRLSSTILVFVCTGNTCRSPMAEAFCMQILAQRIGCPLEEVEQRGFLPLSAGVATYGGSPASDMAIQVMTQYGLDIRNHVSRTIGESLLRCADMTYTMTQAHRQAIVSNWPDLGDHVMPLAVDGADIIDPYGASMELYEECAERIREEVEKRLDDWIGEVHVSSRT